jgi:protein gp37
MGKTKIEWCDEVWNPVWGCHNNCEYCYARKIAARFGKTMKIPAGYECPEYRDALHGFHPVLLPWRLQVKNFGKAKRVFVNSMSDPCCWKQEWMEWVMKRVIYLPQHDFIFLSKSRGVLEQMLMEYPDVENLIIGLTDTGLPAVQYLHDYPSPRPRTKLLFNIEPILAPFTLEMIPDSMDWIIIGAETGNRKDKVIPEWSWYAGIVAYAVSHGIPVFLKPSLQAITPPEYYLQQFPGGRNA